MEDDKITYIKCECGTEVLHLEDDNEMKQIYVSVYTHGSFVDCRLSWKEKFRYCWQVLTKGKPFSDQMVISHETSGKLVEFIKDVTHK